VEVIYYLVLCNSTFYAVVSSKHGVSGTHISNTRDAAAFALISEEGIAKGVRRITAVTAECASQAMKLASSIDTDIDETSKLDGVLLEKVLNFSFYAWLKYSAKFDIT
jgi:alanyl-tRNA synthetase